jgi:DNA-binding transcriptional LysR family regulator
MSASRLSPFSSPAFAMFRDPLLVPSRTGRGMIPTARALELRGPLRVALKDLETVIKHPPAFDPLTANRSFAIAASDYSMVVLGVGLIERVQKVAGADVRVSFRSPSMDLIATQLERGQVDLLISSERDVPTDMKSSTLLVDRFLMTQCKGHPRGRKPLDLKTYCALSHVLVSMSGGSFRGEIDEQLEKIGRQRRVVLSIHQSNLAPMVIRITDYVATLPARFLDRFTDELDTYELPFKARGFTLSASWHSRNQADPSHIWLRKQLSAVAAGGEVPRRAATE